ncbi:MAG: redoxin domain-containing protein [Planctomycetota bacterium]
MRVALGWILWAVSTLPLLASDQKIPMGPIGWGKLTIRDARGNPIPVDTERPTVVAFLGTECPLAKLYGKRLQSLAERFADDGVGFLGVNSNVQDSPLEILDYARRHGIGFPIAKDTDQSIADAFSATRTPEVFVVTPNGWIAYQGRIDDQYQPGLIRTSASRADLEKAIEDVVAGRPVEQARLPSVGCLITRVNRNQPRQPGQPEPTASITFNRDIAPILFRHCAECHRHGEIGPMELIRYEEVVGWGDMILEVIDQERMPPWHADPEIGEFVGARAVPDRERDLIAAWLRSGMAEGDPADLPTPPTPSRGWHFSDPPDHVFEMRDRPLELPAEGIIEYQYFVVDPGWETDRWVRAAQVMPGNRDVLHHAIVFVRPPDHVGAKGIGWVGSYVPGQRATVLPEGHARRVPAGSKLVFQMHYTPNGTPQSDRSRVGIWEADPAQVSHQVMTHVAINHQFEIPPDTNSHVVSLDVDRLPVEGRILGVMPHMHVRGKSFWMQADTREGRAEPQLSVPRYDFNWQHWYQFASPIDLSTLRRLDMRATFDNSRDNPTNPAPNEYVSWGDQTWEEMAVAFLDVAVPRDGHRVRDARRGMTPKQRSNAIDEIDTRTDSFLDRWDANRDGIVSEGETSTMFRKHGFRKIDANRNQKIERDELTEYIAERIWSELFP